MPKLAVTEVFMSGYVNFVANILPKVCAAIW